MAHQSDLIATDIEAYLKAHETKSLLRFLTCGSVDDGKSTLIGRLLYDSKMIFEDQLAALDLGQAPLQWAMADQRARALLQRWTTWRLLSGLAGQPLAEAVQGLSLGIEAGQDAGASVHVRAQLGFG